MKSVRFVVRVDFIKLSRETKEIQRKFFYNKKRGSAKGVGLHMKKKICRASAALAAACIFLQSGAGLCASLTLEEAVELALGRNYDVMIAQKDVEKADQQLEGARGQQKPSLKAGVSLGVNDVDDRGFSRTNSNNLTLSMPLYTGGKNELNVAKAKDSVQSSHLSLGRTQENIRLDTVLAYYNILEAEKIVKVNAEAVENYEEHLRNVQALYSAGSTPRVDVLRSEVELADARQALLQSENQHALAVNALKNIIRMDAEVPLTLADDAAYVPVAMTLEECVALAPERRKDLEKYRVAVAQAKKDVGIARSDKLPSVSLSVGNGWDKQVLPSDDNHSFTAGVSASWNLFDSNVTESNIKAAQIALEQAEFELAKQADAAEYEVRDAYLSLREAEKRFATTQTAVNKAEEDYFIAREKYRAGEGILLDVIDAQLALSTAKKNYIQATYDYATYQAKLENATGLSEGELK